MVRVRCTRSPIRSRATRWPSSRAAPMAGSRPPARSRRAVRVRARVWARVFAVSPAGLALASRTASGGTVPISLAVHGNVLYVLNAGGSGNISGFTVGSSGDLTPIGGATLPLSGSTVGPAEVQFSPDGSRLVVTEKNTNLLDVYAVDATGAASGPTTTASAGGTPFGFAFGLRNDLFVSEAAGSASSYVLDATGTPALVSGAVATHQGAPCWAVVTADGRFGFTGNGAGSVSAFAIAPDGAISLVDADQRHRAEPQQPLPVRAADRRRPGDPRVPRRGGRAPYGARPGRGPSGRHERTRGFLEPLTTVGAWCATPLH